MILLSPRQKNILQQLVQSSSGIKITSLAKEVGISRRTVYREFSELKLYLSQHHLAIENVNGSYRLKGSQNDLQLLTAELDQQSSKLAMSAKQRQAALACMLLLKDQPEKIFSLAVSLDVSEGTIQRDLKQLETSLTEYHLQVDAKKSVGVEILGSEAQRRLVLGGILTSQLNEYEFFEYLKQDTNNERSNFFLQLLPKSVLWKCAQALKQENVSKKTRSDIQEVQLILILAISLVRMQHSTIKAYRIKKPQTLFKYRQEALAVFQMFSAEIQSRVTTAEIDFMAVQFQGVDYQLDLKNWGDDYDLQVTYQVKHLVYRVAQVTDWNFNHDHDLLERLTKHIGLLLQHHGPELPDVPISLLSDIAEKYPKFFQAIQQALPIEFAEYHFSTTEQELILLYFANSYENANNTGQLKALVICANGIGAASILKSRLQQEIPAIAEVEIAKVSQLKKIHPNHFDLILSTLKLPGFNWDYQVVSPLLLGDELQRIKELVRSLNEKFPVQTSIQTLSENSINTLEQIEKNYQQVMLCRKVLQQIKLVEIDNGSQNLQQVLELILQKVSPAIVTDRRIVQAEMLKRVKLAPVGIPDSQIALVHATNKSVNCPFFSVFQLKKSLKMRAMDQSEISVIRILLMAGPAPMSDFENVLMGSISSSIVMNNHNTQVYANGSLVEIKNLVALQFLNQIKF